MEQAVTVDLCSFIACLYKSMSALEFHLHEHRISNTLHVIVYQLISILKVHLYLFIININRG